MIKLLQYAVFNIVIYLNKWETIIDKNKVHFRKHGDKHELYYKTNGKDGK